MKRRQAISPDTAELMPDGEAEVPPHNPAATSTVTQRCVSARCRQNPDSGELRPQPVAGRSLLCRRCQDRLDRQLRELPQLYTELEHAQSVAKTGELGSEGQAPGVPLSPRTVETRTTIRSVLASWAQLVVDERKVVRPARSVAGMAQFLRRYVDWLAEQPAAGDIATEISELAGAAVRLIHAEASWRMVVARCSEPDCAGDLVAWMRPLEPNLPSEIRCSHNRDHGASA